MISCFFFLFFRSFPACFATAASEDSGYNSTPSLPDLVSDSVENQEMVGSEHDHCVNCCPEKAKKIPEDFTDQNMKKKPSPAISVRRLAYLCSLSEDEYQAELAKSSAKIKKQARLRARKLGLDDDDSDSDEAAEQPQISSGCSTKIASSTKSTLNPCDTFSEDAIIDIEDLPSDNFKPPRSDDHLITGKASLGPGIPALRWAGSTLTSKSCPARPRPRPWSPGNEMATVSPFSSTQSANYIPEIQPGCSLCTFG